MRAVDDLWMEAKKDNDRLGDELLKPLVEWRGRALMRIREALELGYAEGRLATRSALENALMDACVREGVAPRTTDALVRALRAVTVREMQEPKR